MRRILNLCILVFYVGVLSAVNTDELNIVNLLAMPNVTLGSDDIINMLGGSKIGRNGRVWSLVGTSFAGNIGHINDAHEVTTSQELHFDWLFYVKEIDGERALVLHKIFCSYLGDERLLISTPITDDVADNPWVSATTVCGAGSAESFAHIKQLFAPFMKKE